MSEVKLLRLLEQNISNNFKLEGGLHVKEFIRHYYYIDFIIKGKFDINNLEKTLSNIGKLDKIEYEKFSDETTYCKLVIHNKFQE